MVNNIHVVIAIPAVLWYELGVSQRRCSYFVRRKGLIPMVAPHKETRVKLDAKFVEAKFLTDSNSQHGKLAEVNKGTVLEKLRQPHIQQAIEERRAELRALVKAEMGIDADLLMLEYGRIAMANISDVMTWDDNGVVVKSSEELPPDVLAAVAEIRQEDTKEGRRITVKMHDKVNALDSLASRLWPVVNKNENLNVNVTIADLVKMLNGPTS